MPQIAADYSALYYEVNLIIQGSALAFLIPIKQKPRYVWFLAAYFLMTLLNSAGWLLLSVVFDETWAAPLLYLRVSYTFAPYFFTLFCYEFPSNIHQTESRVYALTGFALCICTFVGVPIETWNQPASFVPSLEAMSVRTNWSLLLFSVSNLAHYSFCLLLVCRKARRMTGKDAEVMKSYAFVILLLLALMTFFFFTLQGIIKYRTFSLFLSIGFNIVALLDIAIFLNRFPNHVSFLVRMSALFIVGALTTISIFARIAFGEHEAEATKTFRASAATAILSPSSDDHSIDYVLRAPVSTPDAWDTVRASVPAYMIPSAQNNLSLKELSSVQTSDPRKAEYCFKTVTLMRESFVFVAGSSLINYRRRNVQPIVLRMMLATVLIGVGMTLFISILVRFALVRPLDNLLGGLRRVNGGDYNTTLPVIYEDEIGFVTGSFNTMVGSIRTALKAKEEAQLEAVQSRERSIQDLEHLNRIKDEFLANTSHELRTPLQGILSLAENLKAQGSPADAPGSLDLIISSARRLASLVNDVLDYSHMKHRRIQLRMQSVALRPLVDATLDPNRRIAEEKGLRITNALVQPLPPVYADENRLLQVLQNLIVNALKFTERGSIRVSAKAEGRMLRISVADTGIGISPDRHEAIFASFEQADGGVARKYGGAGLGLSISRGLVELHGGTMRVFSRPGTGSLFQFTLRVAGEPPAQKAPAHNGARGPAHETSARPPEISIPPVDVAYPRYIEGEAAHIMLVDDDSLILEAMAHQLKATGHRMTLCTTGRQALTELKKRGFPYDAIVLDVMMPEFSGLSVCREIRCKYSLIEQPILLVTAKSQTADLISGLAAGANDYLTKPYETEQLLWRLKNLLQIGGTVQRDSLAEARRRGALQEQERIYADLHDSLGAQLTDLQILVQRLGRGPTDDSFSFQIQEAVQKTQVLLRERLLHREDMRLLQENFSEGLQLILLRRYANSERPIEFHKSGDFDGLANNISELLSEQAYPIIQEIVTNDVKYGQGKAEWKVSLNSEGLAFELRTHTTYDLSRQGSGRGTEILTRRVAALHGTLAMTLAAPELRVQVALPFRWPAPV